MASQSSKRPKRPRDFNEIAHQVFLESIGEEPVPSSLPVSPAQTNGRPKEPRIAKGKNQAAVALSKLGAKKGGEARASSMTPEQRKELAKKAATARWAKRRAQ